MPARALEDAPPVVGYAASAIPGGGFDEPLVLAPAGANVCFAEINGDNVTDFSGDNAQALRNALAAVVSGGTVKIAGLCAGVTNQGGADQVALVTKTVTLIGGYADGSWMSSYPITQPTVLDAQAGGRVLTIDSVPASLADLTVRNGNATGSGGILTGGELTLTNVDVLSNTSTLAGGGGAYIFGVAMIVGGSFRNNLAPGHFGVIDATGGVQALGMISISGTHFISNTSRDFGGGVRGGPVFLTNTLFVSNSADYGGGVYAGRVSIHGGQFISNSANDGGGGLYATTDTAIEGARFQGNRSIGDGAGVFNSSGLMVITNTLLIDNVAKGSGGGLYTEFGEVTLFGGQFQNNRATRGGGGVFAGKALTTTNTLFIANSAARGGGVLFQAGVSRVTNALFARNVASTSLGAAIFISATAVVIVAATTIASPTVAAGSAIYVLTGTLSLRNTIIASHTLGISRSAGSVSENFNLFDRVITPRGGVISVGASSFTATAGFVDLPAGDHHLAPGSAAIDAGTHAGTSFDFEGDPRPMGGGFDIGYDEFRPLSFLPLVRR